MARHDCEKQSKGGQELQFVRLMRKSVNMVKHYLFLLLLPPFSQTHRDLQDRQQSWYWMGLPKVTEETCMAVLV